MFTIGCLAGVVAMTPARVPLLSALLAVVAMAAKGGE